jgi:tRNA G18 (ribose-2'-O)-methylase SpoU
MASQHSHRTSPFLKKSFPIVLVCDGVQSPANIGALFRLADAFGVQEIIFGNAKIDFSSSRLQKTARNTHQKIPYSLSNDICAELIRLRNEQYELIALEISEKSIPLDSLTTTHNKQVLVIGGERHGVSDEVLAMASSVVHIEMFGENSSMNLAQAAAIALYALTKI